MGCVGVDRWRRVDRVGLEVRLDEVGSFDKTDLDWAGMKSSELVSSSLD